MESYQTMTEAFDSLVSIKPPATLPFKNLLDPHFSNLSCVTWQGAAPQLQERADPRATLESLAILKSDKEMCYHTRRQLVWGVWSSCWSGSDWRCWRATIHNSGAFVVFTPRTGFILSGITSTVNHVMFALHMSNWVTALLVHGYGSFFKGIGYLGWRKCMWIVEILLKKNWQFRKIQGWCPNYLTLHLEEHSLQTKVWWSKQRVKSDCCHKQSKLSSKNMDN